MLNILLKFRHVNIMFLLTIFHCPSPLPHLFLLFLAIVSKVTYQPTPLLSQVLLQKKCTLFSHIYSLILATIYM